MRNSLPSRRQVLTLLSSPLLADNPVDGLEPLVQAAVTAFEDVLVHVAVGDVTSGDQAHGGHV